MDNLPLVPVPFLRWALVLVSASAAIATRDAASISVVHAIIVGRAGPDQTIRLINLKQTFVEFEAGSSIRGYSCVTVLRARDFWGRFGQTRFLRRFRERS